MKASLVYLCGPIHGMGDQDCRHWRQKASELLRAKNIMTIDPMSNDCRGREGKFERKLVETDKRWVSTCDTLLANCWTPSYGTAMEIFLAWQQHKQVIVVTGSTSPWLSYHANRVHRTIEDAIDWIEPRV